MIGFRLVHAHHLLYILGMLCLFLSYVWFALAIVFVLMKRIQINTTWNRYTIYHSFYSPITFSARRSLA